MTGHQHSPPLRIPNDPTFTCSPKNTPENYGYETASNRGSPKSQSPFSSPYLRPNPEQKPFLDAISSPPGRNPPRARTGRGPPDDDDPAPPSSPAPKASPAAECSNHVPPRTLRCRSVLDLVSSDHEPPPPPSSSSSSRSWPRCRSSLRPDDELPPPPPPCAGNRVP